MERLAAIVFQLKNDYIKQFKSLSLQKNENKLYYCRHHQLHLTHLQ